MLSPFLEGNRLSKMTRNSILSSFSLTVKVFHPTCFCVSFDRLIDTCPYSSELFLGFLAVALQPSSHHYLLGVIKFL